VFASQVVRFILAPFFPPDLQVLTTSLLRVLLISPAIFGVSGLLMGILNAHQHFLLPAIAPSLHWIGWILGIYLFVPRWGIFGLAWGAVLGAVMHLGIQVPGLIKLRGQYFPTLGLRIAEVREVGRLMAPRLVGVAAVQLNFVVNTIIASGQPEGSVTAIDNAWRIMLMPQVVIAQAVAIAALPTFSAQAARGKLDEMRSSLASTLRGVLLLSIPASVGLMLLREPIIAIIFERGAFDAHSTELVSWALLWFAAGLVGHSVVEIVSRSFYALHDTKTPVIIGVGAMTLNVFLSLGFSALFRHIGWAPHGGLALSNSLATTLEMILLLVLMSRRLNGLEGKRILKGAMYATVSTAVMALSILAWQLWMTDRGILLSGGGAVLIGTAIYGLTILSLRVPEVKSILNALRRRT
jgi:putative peptidoglycan lipid II flippase